MALVGSELAEQALTHAQALAKSSDGTIHLSQVTECTTEMVGTKSQASAQLAEKKREG